MILKSIRLSNIRSYVSQKINFPLGSVLLSGDIGSGKSTVLLAVEFALFGIKKGDLSGASLLRHGSREGFVELDSEIEGRNVIIKRTLKKVADDIKQDSGYVIVNGSKKIGTAEELKSAVLDLLGYPRELLKKKDLIYRYTVYTPQEDMKRIIYESKEPRLDTLRKVFNIDKYKRIIDNSSILVAAIKDKKKFIEAYISDMDLKKSELKKKQNEIEELAEAISAAAKKLMPVKEQLNDKKKALEELEGKIRLLNALKRDIDVLDAELNSKIEHTRLNNIAIKKLDSMTELLMKELEGREIADTSIISELIKNKESEAEKLENGYKDLIKKLHEADSTIQMSRKSVEKIISIDLCPFCEQKVAPDHKHRISSREEEKLAKLEENKKEYLEKEKLAETAIADLRRETDSLRKKESGMALLKHKAALLEERLDEKKRIIEMQEHIKKDVALINEKKQKLYLQSSELKSSEQTYNAVKADIELIFSEEKKLEIEKAKLEKEREVTILIAEKLKEEIGLKETAKKELAACNELHNWTEELFTNLMSTIEKHVFVQLHAEFTVHFTEWFNMLIEDETISIRLDDEFSPVILQDGYETFIEELSGGEKTCVALSYRLALNKVINDVVSGIKTKDMLILDEPTDGFSTEQLDRVREVIEQLKMRQLIIVSHEPKIESFVQHVLRISKEGHVSTIN